jgi:hypothetical protein
MPLPQFGGLVVVVVVVVVFRIQVDLILRADLISKFRQYTQALHIVAIVFQESGAANLRLLAPSGAHRAKSGLIVRIVCAQV